MVIRTYAASYSPGGSGVDSTTIANQKSASEQCAFGALTMFVGCQEEHLACKNWVIRCRCGYLSAARCRLFAYGPADATTVPKPYHLLPHLNSDWFYLSGTGSPG